MVDEPAAEKRSFADGARAIFAYGWSHHYIQVFIYLLVLTLVTVLASYLPMSVGGHVFIALLIAAVKAGLVAAMFMHLLHEKILIHRVMAFTAFFFLALVVLSIFALNDPIAGTQ